MTYKEQNERVISFLKSKKSQSKPITPDINFWKSFGINPIDGPTPNSDWVIHSGHPLSCVLGVEVVVAVLTQQTGVAVFLHSNSSICYPRMLRESGPVVRPILDAIALLEPQKAFILLAKRTKNE